jgi:hydrogenase-4 component E
MTSTAYADLLAMAAGGLLLAAVGIVWRRELRSMVQLLAWQGLALAALPLAEGFHEQDWTLLAVGIAVVGLRVVLLPWLLARAVGSEAEDRRESTPLLNTTASLLAVAMLTVAAFAISQPVADLEPTPATRAVPAAFAVILIAIFVMVVRRRALSQAVGFLMLDNGIAAVAFLTTAGVPTIVELGASLDILFAVLILGVLTGRVRHLYGDTDLDQLKDLQD